MLLSLIQPLIKWTRQDWVDYAQIVGGIAQGISVITVAFAAYQIWQTRKDARPGVLINIGEKEDYDTINIFLTNIKAPPVFVRSYEIRYYNQPKILTRKVLDDYWVKPSIPKNDPRNLLKMGDTYVLSLSNRCFTGAVFRSIIKEPKKAPKKTAEKAPEKEPQIKITINSIEITIIIILFITRLFNKFLGRPLPFAEFRFKIPGLPDPRVYFYMIKQLTEEQYTCMIYATTKICKNEQSIKQQGILFFKYETEPWERVNVQELSPKDRLRLENVRKRLKAWEEENREERES